MLRNSVTVLAVAILFAGCAGEVDEEVAAAESTPEAPIEIEEPSSADYAAALDGVRDNLSDRWTPKSATEAAETLNLSVPPEGYALRHEQLVADLMNLGQMDHPTVASGAAAGKAGAEVQNMVCELDPDQFSYCN